MKTSCFSNWSCKNSHIVETEWARLFIFYLIDFSVVILHPVSQLYLSYTNWSSLYISHVQLCCKWTEVCSDFNLSQQSLYMWYVQHELQEQQLYKTFASFLLLLKDFSRVFPIFLLILLSWSAWKTWIPCNIWKSHSGTS